MSRPPASRDRPNRLSAFAWAGIAALVGYYSLFASVRAPLHLFLGLGMLLLALLPAVSWTNSRATPIPVFAIFNLTLLNTYVLPLLNGHRDLLRYPVETITRTALVVLVFQVVLLALHRFLVIQPGHGDFYEKEVIDQRSRPLLVGGLVAVALYMVVSTFSGLIPAGAASILRAGFSGLGIICTFVCMKDWGEGRLSQGSRVNVTLLLLVIILSQLSTLLMVGSISLLCLALIGYVSGAQRVPVLFIVLLFPVLAILHNGKPAMRQLYWPVGENNEPVEKVTLSSLPGFYARWIEYGTRLESQEDQESRDEKITARLLERTSLFHMLAMVVFLSPERQPYLQGSTYWDIPGQFVPRFLWPNKPTGHVSTTKLSVHYGLQREEDTVKTTIGFGLLPEAYANFGLTGACGLAAFLACFFKWIEQRTSRSPLLSFGGILLIIVTTWSIQTEFPLSMWLSSLFQACMVVLFLPMLYRKLFG